MQPILKCPNVLAYLEAQLHNQVLTLGFEGGGTMGVANTIIIKEGSSGGWLIYR
jgi:hypothetical protein